jgi:hypothetical protein
MGGVAGVDYTNYLDIKQMLGPDHKVVPKIIDVLSMSNTIIQEANMMPTSHPDGHLVTISTEEPQGEWLALGQGYKPEDGKDLQFKEQPGKIGSMSRVPADYVDEATEDGKLILWHKDQKFIRGLNKTATKTIFYGNGMANPKSFTGFALRYGSLKNPQVIDASAGKATPGVGKYASITGVIWGPDTASLIYKKDVPAGLQHRREKEFPKLVDLPDGRSRWEYRSTWDWHLGLAIMDYRSVFRICNIDVKAKPGEPGYLDYKLFIDAIAQIPDDMPGKLSIYCNRFVWAMVAKEFEDKPNIRFAPSDKIVPNEGRVSVDLWGLPFRRVDALLCTEEAVQ